MSQLSFTGGAPFATSRRGGYDNAALAQAKDMIQRLGSYQGASQATGVPITVLRETFPNVRRNEFRPSSLMRDSKEEPKQPPLPPKVIIDNYQIAQLVLSTVAQRYRLKYSDLKASRRGDANVRLAKMIFLSNVSYFTSWGIDKIFSYCGFKNSNNAPAILLRHEMQISSNPEWKEEASLVRDRIASRMVAIVGG